MSRVLSRSLSEISDHHESIEGLSQTFQSFEANVGKVRSEK